MTIDVRLRDVLAADLRVFYEHQRDPDANRMAAFPARDRDAFMAHWAKILVNDAIDKKTIVAGGEVAGNVVSFVREGEREVGYWIGRQHWSQGIATKALTEFLVLVTTRPLYARVAKHNVGSIRVLEKCGFAPCGDDKGTARTGDDNVEEVIMALPPIARDDARRPPPAAAR